MRQFQFSLRSILNIRINKEKEWENKLAAITGECSRLQNRINEIKTSRLTLNLDGKRGLGKTLEELKTFELFSRRLNKEEAKLNELLLQKMKEREEVIQGYRKALSERKVIDKLKDKREEDFNSLAKKKEWKNLDDIVSSRYIRDKKGEN